MLLPDNVHSSWEPFLTQEILEKLDEIERKIGTDYNPDRAGAVLRFLTTDLHKVKVIWLGQDVYPMIWVRFPKLTNYSSIINLLRKPNKFNIIPQQLLL